ncbi:MAG: ABC transporter, partial [Ramlibacter sp.]
SMALNEFEGTVMLVSHDRALLRAVCDEFWLVGRGGVSPFDGDLDDYQRYLLDEAKRLREVARDEDAASAAAPAAPVSIATGAHPAGAGGTFSPQNWVSPQEQRKQDAQQRQQLAEKLKPLKREFEQAEKRMAQLHTDKDALEARMGTPLPAAELADAGRKLKAANDALAALEERWLVLSDEIEQAGMAS